MSEQASRPRRRPDAPTRAVAYIRVSTEKQADKGVSLEAQEAKLKAYAQLYELELVETIIDAGVSAKTLERPGLQRALELLRGNDADALLVVKLDRLTRSVRDIGELVDKYFGKDRAALLSVSEQIDTRTPGGRLVLNVLASVSQWEREAIGERTSVAMQHKQSVNEYIGGGAPYGFKVEAGKVVEVEAEQLVIAAARTLRSSGLSLRKVADELARRGHLSRKGTRFEAAQVARMCEQCH